MKKIFLVASFLMIFLTGCVLTPEKEYIYVVKKPPEYLLEDCIISDIKGDTVKDALVQSIENIEALQFCTQDKKTLREYYDTHNNTKVHDNNKKD